MDTLLFSEGMNYHMTRPRAHEDQLKLTGILDYQLSRPDGRILVPKQKAINSIVTDAKNNLLNRFFNGTGTNSTAWAIGLVDASTFGSFSALDTSSSHSSWTEFINYVSSGSHRATWGQGSASGGQITNVVPLNYTFTGVGTIFGIFVISDNTLGGTSGTLWSTAALNTPLPVNVNDVLTVNYTLQL